MSEQLNNEKTEFKTFAYFMAWLAFIASTISLIIRALDGVKVPDKNDFKK